MADERQVFVYKGVEYSLPSTLTPEQAKARILQHLGQAPVEEKKPETKPVEEQKSKRKTSIGEDILAGFASGANAIDTVASLGIYAPIASAYKGSKVLPGIVDEVNRRAAIRNKEWGVGEDQEQGVVGKVVSGLASIPSAPLQAAETAKQFKDAGESTGVSMAAGAVDAGANAIGMLLPGFGGLKAAARVGVGAVSNTATSAAANETKRAISEKEKTQKLLDRNWEDYVADAVVGGGFGLMHKNKVKLDNSKVEALQKTTPVDKPNIDSGTKAFNNIVENRLEGWQEPIQKRARWDDVLSKEAQADTVPMSATPKPVPDAMQGDVPFSTSVEDIAANQRMGDPQADLFIDRNPETPYNAQDVWSKDMSAQAKALAEQQAVAEAQKSALKIKLMNEDPNSQGHLDFNDFGNNDPMSRMPNMRIDENGMPIRADLSMEAQNLENPLQMNMWGDELGPALDQTRSLTEAIDTLQQGTPGRAAAIDNVTGMEGSFGRNVKSSPTRPTFKQEDLGDGYFEVQIKVAGKNAGLVTGQETKTAIRVSESGMAAEHRGKGYVSEAYSKLASDAIKKGKSLESDTSVSESAARVYNSLKDKGFTVEKSPSAILETRLNDKQKYWITTDKTPVFIVSKGQKLFGPRSQQGGQTMLTDLGLGAAKAVSKTYSAAKDIIEGLTSSSFLGHEHIPQDVPVENILSAARAEKDSKSWNATEAGNSMRAAKSQATWMRDTWELYLNAAKHAEVNVRNYVTGNLGAEKLTRSLSAQEKYELAGALKQEMLNRQQYTPEQMKAAGFSTKQLEAYSKLREMQKAALAALNYGREAQGKAPISEQEAYLTSRWNGEIKARVTDAAGNLVYYLSGNSPRDVKMQFKALKEQFPDYNIGKVETIKQTFKGADVESAYSIMADAIGRDNPEFKKIEQWYTDYQATKAHSAMGTDKHFDAKGNIRGFIGDRPGYDPMKEAVALLQSQMDFAKESFHWAALQDGAVKMAPVFQDQYIRDNHPNNLAYLQEQFKMAAGVNEGSFARGVNDGIRSLGFTPSQVFGATQAAKSWFMFQKLTFNLGYGAGNLLQLPFTVPHMADIANKFGKYNPARSVSVATALAIPMAGAHYARQFSGIDLIKNLPDSNFYKDMFNYAEQNGVTSRSIVDEAPLNAGIIGRAGNLTTSSPEAVIRAFAFSLFSDSLKQTGKLSNVEVFKEAERRTNLALGDFRETERAPVFSRMGNIGNVLNTLQTFGINYYQQMNYFMREALRGNAAPLALMGVAQYGISGISGMPGVQTMEKGWELLKGVLPNSMWSKVAGADPRIWALENFGYSGVDGALSTAMGVSFNSRISAPDPVEMLQAPGGPAIEAVKQAGSLLSLAGNPKDPVQQAETAMKLAPSGFTGMLETGLFKDQTSIPTGENSRGYYKSSDLHKRDLAYNRTEEEETLRKYGFRSTKEVNTRNLEWKQTQLKSEMSKRKPSFSDDFFDAVMSGDVEKAGKIETAYTTLYGKPLADKEMVTQINQQYLTALQRQMNGASKLNPTELIRLSKIKKLLDQYKVAQ